MHTRTFSLILLMCIGLFGCKKTEEATIFNIMGIEDVQYRYSEACPIPLNVEYVSGVKGNVTLSVQGLPAGVSASFYPNATTPPFETKLYFTTKNMPGGTYPLKIVGTPVHGEPIAYDMNLKVKGLDEIGCALEVTGRYNGPLIDKISMGTPYLQPIAGKNRIVFNECEPGGFYADLDCDKHTLDIPRQKASSGTEVWGNGTFGDRIIVVHMYLQYPGSAYNHYYEFLLEK